MALPNVKAWLVDYTTAREIFDGQDAHLIQSVLDLINAGKMKYCAHEQKYFRSHVNVKSAFCENADCRCNLSHDIVGIASDLPDRVNGKKHHPSDNLARMIVACAMHYNFGIISSKVGWYISPLDLGAGRVTCLTLAHFSALI